MAVTTDTLQSTSVNRSDSPAIKAFSITPDDNNYLADANDTQIHTRGIMVTVAGNINVVFTGDTAAVVIPVSANVLYPFSLKMVKSTSTTATGIIGFR